MTILNDIPRAAGSECRTAKSSPPIGLGRPSVLAALLLADLVAGPLRFFFLARGRLMPSHVAALRLTFLFGFLVHFTAVVHRHSPVAFWKLPVRLIRRIFRRIFHGAFGGPFAGKNGPPETETEFSTEYS